MSHKMTLLLGSSMRETTFSWKLTLRTFGSKYSSRWTPKAIRALRVSLRSKLIFLQARRSSKSYYKNLASLFGIGFAEKTRIKISWSTRMMANSDCRITEGVLLQELCRDFLCSWVWIFTDSSETDVYLCLKRTLWCKWKEWVKTWVSNT